MLILLVKILSVRQIRMLFYWYNLNFTGKINPALILLVKPNFTGKINTALILLVKQILPLFYQQNLDFAGKINPNVILLVNFTIDFPIKVY